MAYVAPVLDPWLEQEIAQWVNQLGSIWWPTAPWADAIQHSYIMLPAKIIAYDLQEIIPVINRISNFKTLLQVRTHLFPFKLSKFVSCM